MEWGPYLNDLEAVVEQTDGRIVPAPLQNRPELYVHLMDIVEAVTFCESRGYQFSLKTPIGEIAAYFRNFSTFDGSATDFLKLFRAVERLHSKHREEKSDK